VWAAVASTRIIGFGAVAFLVAGCSFAPDYKAPVTNVPQTFKESDVWKNAAPSDLRPDDKWWKAYGDAILDNLEQQVSDSNPTLAVALARNDQALAYLAASRADLFPQIGVSTDLTKDRQSDNRPLRGGGEPDVYQADTVEGQISYELDLWGRIRNSIAASKAQAIASSEDMAAVKLSLESELALNYMALRGFDRQIELLKATVEAYAQAEAMTQRRFAGGVATGIDVGQSGTQLAEAESQLDDVQSARALTEHAIASLVGTPASSFSISTQSTQLGLINVPPLLPSELLQRRPDIAAAERRVAAANAEIGVARAAFFPSISLTGDVGYQNTGLPGLFTAPNILWSLGPSALLTLFDGGAHRAQVDVARSAWTQATAEYRNHALRAFQEVEDDLAQLHHLHAEALAENRAVIQAGQVEKLSLNRYVLGAVSYLDVVTAQATALRVRRNAIDLNTRLLQSNIHLVEAIGGGWALDKTNELQVSSPHPVAPAQSHT
jgi:NodT family efflux transporter outer membrane factor (OMF) lipoprotein